MKTWRSKTALGCFKYMFVVWVCLYYELMFLCFYKNQCSLLCMWTYLKTFWGISFSKISANRPGWGATDQASRDAAAVAVCCSMIIYIYFFLYIYIYLHTHIYYIIAKTVIYLFISQIWIVVRKVIICFEIVILRSKYNFPKES